MNTNTGEVVEIPEALSDNFDVQLDKPWVKLSDIFKTGKAIEIEGTHWEIRRADIRPGNPAKMLLKLRSLPRQEGK